MTSTGDGVVVLRPAVRGSRLDAEAARLWLADLAAAGVVGEGRAGAPPAVVLDLTGLTVCCSLGVEAARRAAAGQLARGGRAAVAADGPAVAALVQLAGLARLGPVTRTTAEAAAALEEN